MEFLFNLKDDVLPPAEGNLEAWGRKIRYRFFSEVLKKRALDCVCTAHTADDVAETLLMKLIANKELRTVGRYDKRRRCLRPLLDVTRREIEQFVNERRISFREDLTNSDERYLRNKVRHRLIPFLKREVAPRIVELLSKRAQAVASDITGAEEMLRPILSRLKAEEFGSAAWQRLLKAELEEVPSELKWRVAQMILKDKLRFNLGRSHAERALLILLGSSQGGEFPGGMTLYHAKGRVILRRTCSSQEILLP